MFVLFIVTSKKVKTVIILTFSALNLSHFEQFPVFLLEIHINPDFWGHFHLKNKFQGPPVFHFFQKNYS